MDRYISYPNIVEYLNIQKGDRLLVASDVTRLAFEAARHHEDFNSDRFIDALQVKVGDEGTLLFPTYNWGFCTGKPFDYKRTESLTGALSRSASRRKDFRRTKHPIYSFAVWGKDAERLCSLNNKSSFGSDSPFHYLREEAAKMLMIDTDYQHALTFVHYVEQWEKVDYRYEKTFTGMYIDEDGKARMDSYSMYVRDLDRGVVTNLYGIGEKIDQLASSEYQVFNGIPFRLISLADAFTVIQEDIRNNEAKNLYTLEAR
jgi:aminoglycoside 3-N-acetyltransferase